MRRWNFWNRCRWKGRIRYAGFSFHDDLPVFREIVDAYPWDFCQIQFNYMDECHQAGLAGLKYAASKGLGVVIMEPLRGGRLVRNLPPEVEELFRTAPIKRSPAEWALRWVADHPEVSVILSGMHQMSDVEENVRVLSEAKPHSLSKKNWALSPRPVSFIPSASRFPAQTAATACPVPKVWRSPAVPALQRSQHVQQFCQRSPPVRVFSQERQRCQPVHCLRQL